MLDITLNDLRNRLYFVKSSVELHYLSDKLGSLWLQSVDNCLIEILEPVIKGFPSLRNTIHLGVIRAMNRALFTN